MCNDNFLIVCLLMKLINSHEFCLVGWRNRRKRGRVPQRLLVSIIMAFRHYCRQDLTRNASVYLRLLASTIQFTCHNFIYHKLVLFLWQPSNFTVILQSVKDDRIPFVFRYPLECLEICQFVVWCNFSAVYGYQRGSVLIPSVNNRDKTLQPSLADS